MNRMYLPAYCSTLLLVGLASSGIQAEEALLERDVLPLLAKQCMGCHGGLRQKGGLDLRTVPAMIRGGESGSALKSGDLNASLLWKKVASDEMPPSEKKLSAAEKDILKQWIQSGLPTVAQKHKIADPLLPSGTKHDPRDVAKAIDQHIERTLTTAKMQPVGRSDDAEFMRRVYLDITGRVPTTDQAVAFLDSKDPNKRAVLIDTLLARPEFGEQFGRTWRNWIAPPELPSDGNGGQQPHKQTQELGKWFATRFAAGDSWDKITREILTVDGDIKNKPQVIFYALVGEGGKSTPDGTARAVASLFMGVQLQCAQCHDDPYRSWAQQEHWALAAFFNNAKADFNKVSETPITPTNKNGTQITIPKTAFKNAGTGVPAAFLGGTAFRPTNETSLRSSLVEWLIAKDNPFFARAFANRLWFYFFSRGIVNPVDDFRDLNPPSHPGLMTLLTNEFSASGYDIKHLIRCICNSETYQRTSRVTRGTSEQTIGGLTALFGRMPVRVMNADTLYDSLKLAYGDPKLDLRAIDPKDGNTNGESAPVADAYLEFLRRFGTNEEDATDFTHGIPQMLTMINHPRLLAGSKALESYLKTRTGATPEQVVEWLYLATLSRRPTTDEQSDAMAYLKKAQDPTKGYAGILWMLVNRSEYLLVR